MTTRDPGCTGSVLLLSRNQSLIQGLAAALAAVSLALESFEQPEALVDFLHRRGPAPVLVLVDGEGLRNPSDLGDLVVALRSLGEVAPLLACLAMDANLPVRLAALRAGVTACLSPTMEPAQLAERLLDLAGVDASGPPRVLVVEDQPVAALFAARVLESAGLVTEQVRDPLLVLAALERFDPDLILMDLHLPGISGIELTALIRGQERFADLPIVFVSGELDRDQQLNALRVGGNDFLAKPVPPQVLVQVVRQGVTLARVRARRQRALASLDPATGLASREYLLERLDRQLGGAGSPQGALIYLENQGAPAALGPIAADLTGLLDSTDLLARVGEHGIAALVRRSGDLELARLVESVGALVCATLGEPRPGASWGLGWCCLVEGGDEAVTLVSRARKAARLSLGGGQGRAERYRPRLGQVATDSRRSLLSAIESQQYQLLFQPMVDLRDPGHPRYEGTLRLRTDDGELHPPSDFVPLALSAGLLGGLDRWELEAALDALVACRAHGRTVDLFLHQSMATVAQDGWIYGLRDAINRRDLVRLRPVMQFQMADLGPSLDLGALRFAQLERLGIRVCLNGFADESRGELVLDRIPAAFVRLSRRVTLDLQSERLADLVSGLHARGSRVIATGVDGPDLVARLWGAGVDLVQGPFVQSPGEAMEFDFGGSEFGS